MSKHTPGPWRYDERVPADERVPSTKAGEP